MGGHDYLRLDKNRDRAYQFDHAFGPDASSTQVYAAMVERIVDAVVAGFHGSCFAYGATGSGKTFSMIGSAEAPGVMPLAMSDLFAKTRADDECEWRISLSYVEIYNERVKDLLNPRSTADLEVREDARQGTHIAGAVETPVATKSEILELVSRGSVYRTTEATNCNEVSSRSHAVLQLSIQAVERYGDSGGRVVRRSKLSLIDLAGSERAYRTENRGARLVEGRNINRSLLSLANCINALADRTRRTHVHVPYRDSKLTRLLRDSLSGTSISTMLCNVSPASDQYDETLNTLKYANRAKQMTPPQIPQRQVEKYSPVSKEIDLLSELKDTIVKLCAPEGNPRGGGNVSASAAERAGARAAGGGGGVVNGVAVVSVAVDGAAQPATARGRGGAISSGAPPPSQRPTEGGARGEVRRALASLVDRDSKARLSTPVQAAYVTLDNMEAEELVSISAESALLWKEQQSLLAELAATQQSARLLRVRFAWREAYPDADARGSTAAPAEEMRSEAATLAETAVRLRAELDANRKGIAKLQADIPSRVVSSQRLSLLKLTMTQQQATTEALRFKQQARNKVALAQKVLSVWREAMPPPLRALMGSLFDVPATGGQSNVPSPPPHDDDDTRPCAEGASALPPLDTAAESTLGLGSLLTGTMDATDDAGEDTAAADDDAEGVAAADATPRLVMDAIAADAAADASDGSSSPWRNLGALAIRAALDPKSSSAGGGSGNGKVSMTLELQRATKELERARRARESLFKFAERSSEAGFEPPRSPGPSSPRPKSVPSSPHPAELPSPSPSRCSDADGPSEEAAIAALEGEVAAWEGPSDPLMQSYHGMLAPWMEGASFGEGAAAAAAAAADAAVASAVADGAAAPEGGADTKAAHGPPATSRAARPPPPPPPGRPSQLPAHWSETRDASGNAYYYNAVTRAVSWTRPSALGAYAAPPTPTSRRKSSLPSGASAPPNARRPASARTPVRSQGATPASLRTEQRGRGSSSSTGRLPSAAYFR